MIVNKETKASLLKVILRTIEPLLVEREALLMKTTGNASHYWSFLLNMKDIVLEKRPLNEKLPSDLMFPVTFSVMKGLTREKYFEYYK